MRSTRFALAARTAGVLLVAVVLTFTMCHDTRAATASETAAERMLLPSAGWNGRPIRTPHRHETVRTAAADAPLRGWSAGPVRLGAGFRHPGGSDRVREVQRRLARLGYRVGPADGLFGRRTRASVAWFQVKHGLPVNGRATLATVRHLRARAATRDSATVTDHATEAGQVTAASQAPAWEAFRQLIGRRNAVPGGRGVQASTPASTWVLIALVAVNALLLLALPALRRSPAEPVRAEEPDAPAAVATREERPARRFAPPAARPEQRPAGSVPARGRERRS
jgi:peptidoglycan hydrolase-like protein with peptidoglycan-binding domain